MDNNACSLISFSVRKSVIFQGKILGTTPLQVENLHEMKSEETGSLGSEMHSKEAEWLTYIKPWCTCPSTPFFLNLEPFI